jgi:cell division protease FtsH
MDEPRSHQPKSPSNSPSQWVVVYLIAAFLGLLFLNEFIYQNKRTDTIPYSQFLRYVDEGKVESVLVAENRIVGDLKEPNGPKGTKEFVTYPVNDPGLVARLHAKSITFRAEPHSPFLTFLASWLLPILVFYLIWAFLFRRITQSAPGGMLGLTKSRARLYVEKDTKTTFADVAGADEAKDELKELVSFLQNPKCYTRLGGRAPKGVLLVGPPGTGKTLMARAVAGEAKVPFSSINGSEFVEMFVGLGAARVRDLFEQARKQAPCILFIDEIDALGKSRVSGLGAGANDEKEQTLNQLLAEMDGFDSSDGVIILGATNRPEVLDPALLRAGRFDRQVLIGLPDRHGREQILKVHVKKIRVDPQANVAHIAALTPGFSGADLANVVNEAAIFATRRNADAVSERDFTMAIERIIAGLEQRKKLMNPLEKKRIAYHEMGHATVALSRTVEDKVHKISIIPRGMGALGYTLQRPTEDRYLVDREEMMRKISVLLGGRASEKLFFREISTGAADDLAKATDLARAMVAQYGMSERFGLAVFENGGTQYLATPYGIRERAPFSEKTAEGIDAEVKATLNEALSMAIDSLQPNIRFVEEGAKKLLETETLDEDEVLALWDQYGRVIDQPLKVIPA